MNEPKMEKEEQRVVDRLHAHGFNVKQVPCKRTSTCDVFASKAGEHFLIEIKTRDLPAEHLKSYRTKNEFFIRYVARPTESRKRRLTDAKKQLLATSAPRDTFRLIWYSIREHFPEEIAECDLVFSLYGICQMRCRINGITYELDCYYWEPSFFASAPSVVATIIERDGKLTFCLNEFSPDLERFRISSLFSIPKLRVFDPKRDEANRLCLAARSGEHSCAALRRKYRFDDIEDFAIEHFHAVKRSVIKRMPARGAAS